VLLEEGLTAAQFIEVLSEQFTQVWLRYPYKEVIYLPVVVSEKASFSALNTWKRSR